MAFRRWPHRGTPRRMCAVPTCPCYASEKDDHCNGHRAAKARGDTKPPEVTVAEMIEIVLAERKPRALALKQASLFDTEETL